MPGIPMQVFRKQLEQLLVAFTLPVEFHRQLVSLFERYGISVYRAGESLPGVPEPAYHVPLLAIREIEAALLPLAAERPQAALRLVRELWQDRHYEVRCLGAYLLGCVGMEQRDAVLAFFEEKGPIEERDDILIMLLDLGSHTLRREAARLWITCIKEWSRSKQAGLPRMAHLALFSIVRDEEFENLPPVFSLLEPVMLNPSRWQEAVATQLIHELAQRSPMECAYFLHEIAPFVKPPRARRMMRSFVELFEGEAQERLRISLKENREPEEDV